MLADTGDTNHRETITTIAYTKGLEDKTKAMERSDLIVPTAVSDGGRTQKTAAGREGCNVARRIDVADQDSALRINSHNPRQTREEIGDSMLTLA